MKKRFRGLKDYKFCHRCRKYMHYANFNTVPNGPTSTRKDTLCGPCRDIRDFINANKRPSAVDPLRAKELALIPNPFIKHRKEITDYSNLLWSDCV